MTNLKPAVKKQWFDLLVLSVIAISIVALLLFVFGAFNPKIAVFVGLALAVPIYFFITNSAGGVSDVGSVGIAILAAVVLIALTFRAEPYPWINGGQDQGVYVSMSSYYQHGGKVFIEDNVLSELSDEELKNIYTKNRERTVFHLGVYYGGDKDYVFQFYHLHPLWMAIFADFLGDDARGYSLIFFAILSIVFLSLLVFELTGSRLASLCVGLLIAINPLHVFFSKWPVTEVVALAFSSMGFYYLARAYKFSKSTSVAWWALVISCLCLSLVFFVRISGFFYLPLLASIFMVGSWLYRTRGDKFGTGLMLFVFACIAFYVLSVFYGLKYSPNYSRDIYSLTFGKIVGQGWAQVMIAGLAFMLLAMYAWYRLLNNAQFVSKVNALVQTRILILGMLLFIAVTVMIRLYKVYKLGYSDTYGNDPWLNGHWKLSGAGGEAVARSSVINWLIYTSPALVLFGGLALLRRKLDFRLVLVLVLVGSSLGVFLLLNPILPYQYYYARYLVSESVPYAIVGCVVALFSGESQKWRRIGIIAVLVTIPLFGYYSFKQIGAEEGVRPLSVLRQIAGHVEKDDVLLIEPSQWKIPRFGVETPLRFYFGLKTFVLPKKARDVVSRELANSFRNVWLLSPVRINDDRFVLEERLLHYDKVVERTGHIPTKILEDFWHQELFLYVLKKPGYPSSRGEIYKVDSGPHAVSFDSYETSSILGVGWHSLEQRHVWSSGMAVINLKKSMFVNDKWPKLTKLDIAPYAATPDRPVKIEAYTGGRRFNFNYTNSARSSIEIPLDCKPNSEQCKIEFSVKNATSPHELGASSDARVLGFAMYSFSFE